MLNRIIKMAFIAGFFFAASLLIGGHEVKAQTGIPSDVSSDIEQIIAFQSAINVQSDRTVKITEVITYQFGTTEHHGIYRDIPQTYQRNGATYRLHFKIDQILMDGSSVPYSITSTSPTFSIRIGDVNQLIGGTHIYTISYETDRAINFFSDHDELYWNVTGDDWQVPIQSASVAIRGPSGFNATSSTSACYTGVNGSTAQDCKVFPQGDASTVWLATTQPLNPNEGLTVVLSFQKGLITPLTFMARLFQIIFDNLIFLLPIIVFGLMYAIWFQFGKEPKGRGTIIPQYEPPRGLTPMEMSVLKYQSDQPKAVTATIIDLARRGYLKIKYEEKKHLIGSSQSYTFEKGKDADSTLKQHESWLLTGMFGLGVKEVPLSSLAGKYYSSIKLANGAAFASIQSQGFFTKNPTSVRAAWIGVSLFIGFIIFRFGSVFNAATVISLLLSVGIVIAFGWNMPKKTQEGAIALEEVEGFKWFLSVTEKDRLAFSDAPKIKPEMFHQYLSYAIALGVDELWAKQFDGMMVPEPDYVVGYGNMNTLLFINAMHGFNNSFAAAAVPPRSSAAGAGRSGFGGGGFSGGGFGGGGGGSW